MDLDADRDIRPVPAFAHASEAELARILDFYAVAWKYEPRTFPILFDRAGAVLESFSPGLLPSRARRLPGADDAEATPGPEEEPQGPTPARALSGDPESSCCTPAIPGPAFKYGKLALADVLTGADGQTTPPRARPEPSGADAPDDPGRGGPRGTGQTRRPRPPRQATTRSPVPGSTRPDARARLAARTADPRRSPGSRRRSARGRARAARQRGDQRVTRRPDLSAPTSRKSC